MLSKKQFFESLGLRYNESDGDSPGAWIGEEGNRIGDLEGFDRSYDEYVNNFYANQYTGGNTQGIQNIIELDSIINQINNTAGSQFSGTTIDPARQEQIMQAAGAGGFNNVSELGNYLAPAELDSFNNWNNWAQSYNENNMSLGDYLAQAAFAAGTGAIGGAAFGLGPIAEASGTLGSGGLFGASAPISNIAGAGYTNTASLGSGLNDVIGTSSGAGEFGLSGATAGNLAGTGGLSSAAGINGIGQSVGSLLTPGAGTGTSLGLGSGAAGSAALSGAGAAAGSLLTPAMAESAGLLASQAMGGSGLTSAQAMGGTTSVPNLADYIKTGSIDGSTPNPAPQVPSAPVGNGVGLTEAAQAGSGVAAGGSALSRLIDGTATTADYTQLLGGVAGAGLGMYGANQQAQSYENVANKFLDMGQPYRDRLNASYAPGFSMANQPDFMNALDLGSESVLKKLSATGGNPYGNAGAMAEANKYVSGSLALPQLNTYRSQLGTFGQLGTNQAGSAMGAQTQAQGGAYDALGYGIGQLTQPDNPFKGLLDQFKYKPSNGWGY